MKEVMTPKINWHNVQEVEDLVEHLQGKSVVFDLREVSFKPDAVKNLANCLKKISVTGLYLPKLCFNEDNADYFFCALKESQVTDLSLFLNNVGHFANMAKIMNHLKETKIAKFNLSGNKLNHQNIMHLGQVLPSTCITYLNLSHNDLGPAGVEVLGYYLRESHLRRLNLSYNDLGPVGAENLGHCLKGTAIEHLELECNALGSKGLKVLSGYLKGTMIKKLNFCDNKIGFEGVDAFGSILKETVINKVKFFDNNIDFKGVKSLFCHLKSSCVTHLCLLDNQLSYGDLKSLADLFEGTCLTCVLIDGGYDAIEQAINNNFIHYWGKCFAQINYGRESASALPLEVIDKIFGYLASFDNTHKNIFLKGYQAYSRKIWQKRKAPLEDDLMSSAKKIRLK